MAERVGSILVVDDDPEMWSLLQDVLRDRGHHVAVVASGRDTLKRLSEEEYATEFGPPSQTVHVRFDTHSVGSAGPRADRESRATIFRSLVGPKPMA